MDLLLGKCKYKDSRRACIVFDARTMKIPNPLEEEETVTALIEQQTELSLATEFVLSFISNCGKNWFRLSQTALHTEG